MPNEPRFAADLYHGTADLYDRYRLGYPPVLTEDLLHRVQPTGHGCLLDLACGTGQLAFTLQDSFAETWAVDQEPDMVRVVAGKARRGGDTIRAIVARAEDLSADPATFEVITVGNAFHRLRRDVVARRAFGWLGPGGHLALCWSSSPWAGHADWQQALRTVLDRWRSKLGARDRLPPDWQAARQASPDHAVLADAGFESRGRFEFQVEHRWTPATLAGYVYATSFLAGPLFGEHATTFESDLAAHLEPHLVDGVLVDQISYAYDLARKPSGTRPTVR